jgi:Mg2+ and Co2+ transporter CorA
MTSSGRRDLSAIKYGRFHCGRSIGKDPSNVADIAQDAIWIDLLNPTADEKRPVERLLDIEIPDEESLSEIEASSRMISEHGKLYLSSPAVRLDEHGDAYLTPRAKAV